MRALFRSSSVLCAVLFTAIGLLFAAQIDYGDVWGNAIPLGCAAIALAASVAEIVRPGGRIDWTVTGGLGLSLFGAYLIVIHMIGFLPATPLFTMGIFFFARKDKARALATGLLYGIVLAAAVHALFVTGMGNLLPEGIF